MSSNISNFRSWMNNQWDSNGQISKEFAEGLKEFMRFAGNQDITLRGGKMFCPCIRCDNSKFIPIERVWNHLYQCGFTPNYKIWYLHGEVDIGNIPSTSEYVPVSIEESRMVVESRDTIEMVNDAFRDKKVKQIVETVKAKINDQLTQDRSTETNHLTQAEINTLVLRVSQLMFL